MFVSGKSSGYLFEFFRMKFYTAIGLILLILILTGTQSPVNVYNTDKKTCLQPPGINKNIGLKIFLPVSDFIVTASATPDVICQGLMTQLNVTVAGGTPPFDFSWTPASTIINPALANPLASPFETIMYHITVTDYYNNIATDSVLVTVNNAPPAPGPIAGNHTVCAGDTVAYSIVEVAGGTHYSWSVSPPPDSIIGNGNPNIMIIWGAISGEIQVLAGNDCGNNPIPSILPVMVNVPPGPLNPIHGRDSVCFGANETFCTSSQIKSVNYYWTVPPGVTFQSGQGTDTIHVTWGSMPGNLSVYAKNDCGETQATTKWIDVKIVPGPAGLITGKDSVCQGTDNEVYSILPVLGSIEYLWTMPAGVVITSGAGTNEIRLRFDTSALTGNITVKGSNECGYGVESSKQINIKNCLGIDYKRLESSIQLYPNPARNELTFCINGPEQHLTATLTNLFGQEVYSEKLIGMSGFVKTIHVAGFAKGVYLFKLSGEAGIYIEKVIIQ